MIDRFRCLLLWGLLGSLVAACLVLGCQGSEAPRSDDTGEARQQWDAGELAERLASPELEVRERAGREVARLGTSGQTEVLAALEAGQHSVAVRLTRRLAERARDRGLPALAARWYAVASLEPISEAERHDRLLRAIEALLAAGKYLEALELCRTRLTGDYPAEIEESLARLQSRAKDGLAEE